MLRLARFDQAAPTKQQRQRFDCGEPSLNHWLATQARQSLASRDAVTYLLLDQSDDQSGDPSDDDSRIAGYYALSSGSISRQDAATALARRAPEPIPAVVLGRFAIDAEYQGQRLGGDLLAHALRQAVEAGTLIGARVLFLHAVNEAAREFYLHHDFDPSPVHRLLLMRDLRVISASIDAAAQPPSGRSGSDA